LTSTDNECVAEDDEQAILMATQAKKCRPSGVETKSVSLTKYNAMVSENKALAKQIEKYKSTWMRKVFLRA
jgi:1,2-phenylacetyl-CoA epoxidase PaaB subunit